MKTSLRLVCAAVLLALVLLMIPTAQYPSGLRAPNAPLFTLGSLSVTPYSLCMTAGALAGCALVLLLGRKRRSEALSACLIAVPCALLGGHLLFFAARFDVILSDYNSVGMPLLWQPYLGGYTLYGAVLGAGAGVALYALVRRISVPALLDLITPGAALAIFFGRAGEFFSRQSLGVEVENEALQFFPAALCISQDEYWSEWRVPVFAYEALAALAILAVLLCMRASRPGRRTGVFVALLGLTQILLESMRRDGIRFGFVRFNQLAAALTLAAVLVFGLLRALRARKGRWSRWQIVRIALFVLGVGAVIGLEFALDKTQIDNAVLYLVMALVLGVMGLSVLRDGQPAEGEQ